MIASAPVEYRLVVGSEMDDYHIETLRKKLQRFNRLGAPQMSPPEARPLNIQVLDDGGRLVGGLAALTYWGWLVIRLLVLDDEMRGNGIGQRLISRAHEEARARGCRHAQTFTYDFQALSFYLKQGYEIVGELRDYPEGCHYYWLRLDFESDDDEATSIH